jgi:hypothetical protein
MGSRVLREGGPHGVDRDSAQRQPGQFLAATGDEGGDRVEVLAVGLQRVRRRLPRAAIGEERGESLRTRLVDNVGLLGGAGHATVWIMLVVHELVSGAEHLGAGRNTLPAR